MLFAAAVPLVAAACHRADSELLVEVSGDLTLQPTVFLVTMSVDGRAKPTFPVPSNPSGTITLPASFSVELDRSLTGPVTIAVDAQDAGGNTIASGQTTQEHINAGGETVIAVTIVAPQATGPQAATDSDGGGV
jgi:hypothetical protein